MLQLAHTYKEMTDEQYKKSNKNGSKRITRDRG